MSPAAPVAPIPPDRSPPSRGRAVGAAAAIIAATLLAYWPVLRAGFIWDDDGFVTRGDLRSLHGLARIWTEVAATEQYYPLLHSAFWVEWHLWGNAPAPYHLVNVLLHAAGACLVALVLRRWSVPGAWLGGLLFALHPVEVESVAWIAEQKNTLSTVFYLLAAWVYAGAVAGRPRTEPVRLSASRYVFASLCFVLALLCKTVTATLPATLLVALWWRRGKVSWREAGPLLPWLGVGAAAGLFSGWVERTYIGAAGASFALGLGMRTILAGRAVWFYLGKLLWPADLIFIYPRWHLAAPWELLAVFPVAAAIVTAAGWWGRGWSRAPLAIWLIFVGSLFPTLGFFNVYAFVFSYVADHWQYLASIPVLAGLAAAASVGLARCTRRDGRTAGRLAVALVVGALGFLTWRRASTYRDVEAFYRTILARNPACWLAQDNLGVVLANTGRLPEAIAHYETALQLNSGFPQTYNNYGNAMARLRRWPEAFAAYRQAVALRPNFFEAQYDWGNACSDAGDFAGAATHFAAAAQLHPDYPEAWYGWANALANDNQFAAAIARYREALRLRPSYAEARANYGLALVSTGDLAGAIAQLQLALQARPNYAEAHAYLGLALANSHRLPEAVAEFEASLRLNPRDREVHQQLALALRALGRTDEALREFEAAANPASP